MPKDLAVYIWAHFGVCPPEPMKEELNNDNLWLLYISKQIPAKNLEGIGIYYRGNYYSDRLPNWVNAFPTSQQDIIKNAYAGKP